VKATWKIASVMTGMAYSAFPAYRTAAQVCCSGI